MLLLLEPYFHLFKHMSLEDSNHYEIPRALRSLFCILKKCEATSKVKLCLSVTSVPLWLTIPLSKFFLGGSGGNGHLGSWVADK